MPPSIFCSPAPIWEKKGQKAIERKGKIECQLPTNSLIRKSNSEIEWLTTKAILEAQQQEQMMF
jgi:hypothetical protein